jgi:rSAM/selenodomain-associated transferase 2
MPAISAVVPTLNEAVRLPATLAALSGGVGEVVVVDGGSVDGTASVAARAGARVVSAEPGRGGQLAAGADAATGEWLLFLHADTVLDPQWRAEAAAFTADPGNASRAAYFAFALDDLSPAARRIERAVAWRCRFLGMPYGDQGLLIARPFYQRVGGFQPLPLMEDVDLVRRIGRRNLVPLAVRAVTSAQRWRRDGWIARGARNLSCLSLYFLGVPPRLLVRLYR